MYRINFPAPDGDGAKLEFVPPAERRWPGGGYRSLALLRIDIEVLASRCGQATERGAEELGLGDWIAVGGRLPSGLAVEFIHYVSAPEPKGVEVRADIEAPLAKTLDEVLAMLGMARGDALWISPFAA